MAGDLLIGLGREALLIMFLASLPPIGASLLTGLIAGLFQATTQIQEPTLSVVPKLCAAVLALVLAGPWIAARLVQFTSRLLLLLAEVGS